MFFTLSLNTSVFCLPFKIIYQSKYDSSFILLFESSETVLHSHAVARWLLDSWGMPGTHIYTASTAETICVCDICDTCYICTMMLCAAFQAIDRFMFSFSVWIFLFLNFITWYGFRLLDVMCKKWIMILVYFVPVLRGLEGFSTWRSTTSQKLVAS